jgi:alpha-D-ribose 1-methylphosphonate 5-phosphate C-P lyase
MIHLDEIVTDDEGGRMFVLDTDYCETASPGVAAGKRAPHKERRMAGD